MKRLKPILLIMLYFLITFGGHRLFTTLFYGLGIIKHKGFRLFLDNNPHSILLLWFLTSFAILYLVTKCFKKESILKYCGFKKIKGNEIAIMAVIGFGAFIFNTALINISIIDKNFPQFENFLKFNYEASHLFWGVLATIFVGPIFEEFLFRGLIYKELRRVMPLIPAVIITSILYGVMFLDIPLMLFCVVAGILYSFIYVHTNNLVYIIVLQLVATAGVFISRRLGIENIINELGDHVMIPVLILSIAIVISGCFVFKKSLLTQKEENCSELNSKAG